MSEKKPNADNSGGMVKLATFIVDKRNLFFLLLVIGIIFTMFSTN